MRPNHIPSITFPTAATARVFVQYSIQSKPGARTTCHVPYSTLVATRAIRPSLVQESSSCYRSITEAGGGGERERERASGPYDWLRARPSYKSVKDRGGKEEILREFVENLSISRVKIRFLEVLRCADFFSFDYLCSSSLLMQIPEVVEGVRFRAFFTPGLGIPMISAAGGAGDSSFSSVFSCSRSNRGLSSVIWVVLSVLSFSDLMFLGRISRGG